MAARVSAVAKHILAALQNQQVVLWMDDICSKCCILSHCLIKVQQSVPKEAVIHFLLTQIDFGSFRWGTVLRSYGSECNFQYALPKILADGELGLSSGNEDTICDLSGVSGSPGDRRPDWQPGVCCLFPRPRTCCTRPSTRSAG